MAIETRHPNGRPFKYCRRPQPHTQTPPPTPKVPQDPSTLRNNIYYCSSCERYLNSDEFALSLNSRSTGNCRHCADADNVARTRLEFGHYKQMLRALREEEKRADPNAEIAFLVQVGGGERGWWYEDGEEERGDVETR